MHPLSREGRTRSMRQQQQACTEALTQLPPTPPQVPPLLPAVPGPHVLTASRPGWRYSVRQQHIRGGPWATFGDAQRMIYDSPK